MLTHAVPRGHLLSRRDPVPESDIPDTATLNQQRAVSRSPPSPDPQRRDVRTTRRLDALDGGPAGEHDRADLALGFERGRHEDHDRVRTPSRKQSEKSRGSALTKAGLRLEHWTGVAGDSEQHDEFSKVLCRGQLEG